MPAMALQEASRRPDCPEPILHLRHVFCASSQCCMRLRILDAPRLLCTAVADAATLTTAPAARHLVVDVPQQPAKSPLFLAVEMV